MRFVNTLLQAALGTAILAGAWWASTSMLQAGQARPYMLPGPETVAAKVIELIQADAFQQHIWASLAILIYGLLPALFVGVAIGAGAGASSAGRWLFGPLVLTIGAAPLVALLPVLTLWLGQSAASKAWLVFLAAMFPAANAVMVRWPKHHGLRMETSGFEERAAARQGSAGRAAAIFAGLRIGVIFGVTALVVAELVASNSGLGYFVAMSTSMFNTADAMAALLVIIVPTMVVGVLLQAIEEQLAG
jgi:ABC-type nitrate/sulfonate/bicarbonate transport system permease component